MTIDEYKVWKKTRHSMPEFWKLEDCRAADQLVKEETLKSLENKLIYAHPVDEREKNHKLIRDYVRMFPTKAEDGRFYHLAGHKLRLHILLMALYHFGSAETDDFIDKLGAYPDWI